MEKTTTDVQEIREWAANLGGKPEVIESPEAGAEKPALRISFPDEKGEISFGHARTRRQSDWNEFGQLLDELNLALIYNTQPNPNNLPDSYKFVPRDFV